MRRHELRSTIMTSNRPLEDWGKLIGDVPAATAILDRFLQDAELIQITGKSYRLRGRAADTSPGQNAVEPAKPGSAQPATEDSKTGQTRTPARPTSIHSQTEPTFTEVPAGVLHIMTTVTITQRCSPSRSPVGFNPHICGRF